MSRAFVTSICQPLPGAAVSDPWGGGHAVWKVGGKIFASIGAQDRGVSVKCSDTAFARLLIEDGTAERAPYLHASWVLLPWGCDEGLMRDRVLLSYDLIRAGLPKKVQAMLAPRPD
ncbi:MmcQ/YjbR family DNA-binding protein [Pseudooceanicola sp. CBS1P-1]|uniref:MmcQ/YjbR family DNA-binding protein n=1 Tax=Pseudooceanicola albus TaxID=2692189 RepID=A0A6L7GBF9_9RHOB|nr:MULTISPECIES: MmcQ/YjbR family DNA-binding protein [Pseudooceanicola]MBT9384275.1 MmcQ/YjbR family DNA-binding protein [Pseudooceanicola endophyticus]MXN20868.1 MmcQ/YjbR family DNA-binding protein [Pseudooceanicola albus]